MQHPRIGMMLETNDFKLEVCFLKVKWRHLPRVFPSREAALPSFVVFSLEQRRLQRAQPPIIFRYLKIILDHQIYEYLYANKCLEKDIFRQSDIKKF